MRRKGSLIQELPLLVVVALVVSLLIKTFLVQFFYIPSGSMENTLQIQDRVAVNKIPFISRNISRGDVVVFRDPDYWLPAAYDSSPNKIIAKAKEGLVAVGILPNPAKQYLVKRVIGVAGDHVICCTKKGLLTVNGTAITEPYIFKGNVPSDMNFDVTVPEGKIWVMGDHREASADSRYHQDDINKGMVPLYRVTGRVFAVIWPLKNAAYIPQIDVVK
ncbi:MAG: signal peptidase I [Actinobacteria bacterium]|uniref:signal peptidase I n=1 Tax=freshwater metagenome TaxID=449393 RepID=A0A6J6TDT1_9ZZZZ|nr:signal peptidase I [Actinomycetota bacterium]MSY63958.1 signal peptidase I [Actinomycetota bacterium]MSZ90804.1 signal peptidase I [Actinomycetota bacterium]